jgi:hypothetical protein
MLQMSQLALGAVLTQMNLISPPIFQRPWDRTHFRYFTQRMIKELLTDAGFSIHQTTVSAVHLELD